MSINTDSSAVPTTYSNGLTKRELFTLVISASVIIHSDVPVSYSMIDRGVQLADYLLSKLEPNA